MTEEKLSIRLPLDIKAILVKAANLLDISLTEFIVNSSTEAAIKFIKSHNHILEIINNEQTIINRIKEEK